MTSPAALQRFDERLIDAFKSTGDLDILAVMIRTIHEEELDRREAEVLERVRGMIEGRIHLLNIGGKATRFEMGDFSLPAETEHARVNELRHVLEKLKANN